jgi:Arc/MetJ-type ribon-helix-helix transcriptional regulator
VREAIESGRLRREEDAVQEALSLWEERERLRAELLAGVDEAEASLARLKPTNRLKMQLPIRSTVVV